MPELGQTNELTSREIEILALVAEGEGNGHIANQLPMTIRTVKFHTSNLYTKLVVDSRSKAIAWAWKQRDSWNSRARCNKTCTKVPVEICHFVVWWNW